MAFDQMKQLYELQKKAKAIQKKLENEIITASAGDGAVVVEITGEQKIRSIKLDAEKIDTADLASLERHIESAVTQAVAESQRIAAEEMKEVAGGLGLPGL
jgi:nucleoid-associated protein EbfC